MFCVKGVVVCDGGGCLWWKWYSAIGNGCLRAKRSGWGVVGCGCLRNGVALKRSGCKWWGLVVCGRKWLSVVGVVVCGRKCN